jgi:hypothetical protein
MATPRPQIGSAPCPLLTILLWVTVVGAGRAHAGQTTPAAPAGTAWRVSAVNVTRVESWRFFEPQPGNGDPDYTFLGNRLRVEARRRWRRVEVTLAVQHVGLVSLPTRASGPGALGTGALYFEQGDRRENPQQLYLRYAIARFPNLLPGVDLQLGRMAYTSGAEAPSGVPKIEAVKRQRLDSRLVGEFEWSLYQRGFDGVRVDATRSRWRATGIAVMPTQGGFARAAGQTITDIVVAGGTVSSRSAGTAPSRTQVQGFGLHYRDRRPVTQRPDNSGRSATAVDVDVTTIGGVVVGAYPTGPGEADVIGWTAAQAGNWYGDDHQALALAAEAGYQWTRAPWRPWIRAGGFHASGDETATDRRHGTFFPMLPTLRRFSQTTVYSTMNLRDSFVQVLARPRPPLGLRLDVHRLTLASAADLWYGGSGATLGAGNNFGYVGRRSNGSRDLGRSVEASADYALASHVSINAFLARIYGGPVVTGTFRGNRLWYGYVESVVTLGAR